MLEDLYATKEKVDQGKDFFDVFGWTVSFTDSSYNDF